MKQLILALCLFAALCANAADVKSVWVGDTYFELVPWTGTWDQAKTDAEAKGGRMACIKTAVINTAIFNAMVKNSVIKMIYFGGCKVDGRWGWVDGSAMQYTNWQPGQPNSPDTAIVFQPKRNTWNNVPTYHAYPSSGYILEMTREQYNNRPLAQ